MQLLDSFTKSAPNKVFFSIVLGGIAGASYALLIPIILSGLGSDSELVKMSPDAIETFMSINVSNSMFALLFVFTCGVIFLSSTVSQVLLIQISEDVTSHVRLKIYDRIMHAPTDALERFGSSRLWPVITSDVGRLINGASAIPNLLVNIVTLLGMLTFLVYLSADIFMLVIISIVIGVITYQLPLTLGRKYFRRSRESQDTLFDAMKGLLDGTKELKLNKRKRDSYFKNELEGGEYTMRRDVKRAETIMTAAASYGDLISLLVIGFITFIFVNYYVISTEALLGVVMALLYIKGPIAIIIRSVPEIISADISLKRINDFIENIEDENVNTDVHPLPDWQTLSLKNVIYQYKTDSPSRNFTLGPVDLEINRGEVTFIVGGNGSGKSTLSKVISLHYPVQSGSIYFGESEVTPDSVNSCREFISAIFTDFHLFERLLNKKENLDASEISNFLSRLGLDEKVNVEEGRFSTIDLSDGQKKRLSLLVEFIEDREMYIFDEWAADQDPAFKQVFYKEILPELKAKGKAVVVISHDDRFFDVADKVIVMEEGQIIETRRILHNEEGPN